MPPKEPLLTSPLPERPWQRVATDLFELNKAQYLIVVDYFSRYMEVVKLSSTTSSSVINSLKSFFARHGIPNELDTDNGLQFSSHDLNIFIDLLISAHDKQP